MLPFSGASESSMRSPGPGYRVEVCIFMKNKSNNSSLKDLKKFENNILLSRSWINNFSKNNEKYNI